MTTAKGQKLGLTGTQKKRFKRLEWREIEIIKEIGLTRKQAKGQGVYYYVGKPCGKCGNTVRDKYCHCVICRPLVEARARNKRNAKEAAMRNVNPDVRRAIERKQDEKLYCEVWEE